MLESELESSLKKSLQIKEDKMAALESHLQESSRLNQQLRQELKTVNSTSVNLFGLRLTYKNKMYYTSSHTGEAELRGFAAEAGGGMDSIKLHPSHRERQGDERVAA